MILLRLLGAVALIVLIAASVDAGNCGVIVQSHSYATPVVVTPVLAATFVPVPVFVPAYGVGYSAADPSHQIAQLKNDLELEKLRAKIAALESRQPTLAAQATSGSPPALAATAPTATASIQSCVSCHDASAAKSKGGGFAFFANGISTMSPQESLRAIEAITNGSMPKGSTLDPEKTGDAIATLARLGRQASK